VDNGFAHGEPKGKTMNAFSKTVLAGGVGAITTTLLHELLRRLSPDAPRVDLLGMQAVARLLHGAGLRPPAHGPLYTLTLLGDLVSNTAYFSLVGAAPRATGVVVGGALGAAAGVGAVYLPPYLSLSSRPTGRTRTTGAITVALYTGGGLAAGLTYHALPA